MNDLGTTLVWAAGQVTLVAAASALVYAFAARRGAGGFTAGVGLAACAAVTLLALCPVPAGLCLDAAPPSRTLVSNDSAPAVGNAPDAAGAANAAPGFAIPITWLREARTRLAQPTPDAGSGVRWPGVVAASFLAVSGLAALRLLVGLASVRRCVRRSRVADNPGLLDLAVSLRAALGCRRPVALRECDDLSAPATVGWRSPVVLLPAGWRAWGETELRAVLAHELAHVRRADYAAWLAACTGAALHAYHPLVGWLSGRLRLEQELAADALAAPLAGGRVAYLRALAILVLRLDGPAPASPARPFLSSPGTLLRRIAMLRATDGSARRPLPRGARAALAALLAAAALGVAAVRSPAQKAGDAPAAAPVTKSDGERLPEFDLTYLPRRAKGVVALRPAVLFAQPGMEPFAREFDKASEEVCRQFKGSNPLPPVAEIEQLFLFPDLKTDKHAKGEQTSLLFGLSSIRVTHDYDWAGHLKRAIPGIVEVRFGRGSYFKVPREAMFLLARDSMASELFAFAPDSRTLVLDSEERIRAWLGALVPPRRAENWNAAWERVSRCPVAVAMDTSDRAWLDDRRQPEKDVPAVYEVLYRESDHFVVGIDARGGRFTLSAEVGCPTVKARAAAARSLRAVIESSVNEFDAQGIPGGEEQLVAGERAVRGLWRNSVVRADGNSVHFHTEVRTRLADLVGSLIETKDKAAAGPSVPVKR